MTQGITQFKITMTVVVVLGTLSVGIPVAHADTTTRPIEDFVSTQGTFCIDDGSGGCFLFVPPVSNYIGWIAPAQNRFILVDYAGITDAWIRDASNGAVSFGTTTKGTITERSLSDGRTEVTVLLHTKNALTWAIAGDGMGNFDFANGPLLFGHRAPDVLAGQNATLGESFLQLVFINNSAPGAPLPDLIQLAFFPESGQELRFLSFRAQADGELRALFGVPDGTPGRAEVVQTGLLFAAGKANSKSRVAFDAFPAERINLNVVGK